MKNIRKLIGPKEKQKKKENWLHQSRYEKKQLEDTKYKRVTGIRIYKWLEYDPLYLGLVHGGDALYTEPCELGL